jgi:hypothetical protein
MWLMKTERDLLAYYYNNMKECEDGFAFPSEETPENTRDILSNLGYFPTFRKFLRKVKCRLGFKCFERDKQKKRLEKFERQVFAANARLMERKLVIRKTGSSSIGEGLAKLFGLRYLGLSIQGWDLGRKYNNPLASLGLWFAEYKDQGLGVIFGFFGGILGAVVVQWFCNKYFPG